LNSYPKDFTIAAHIYQVSLSSQQSRQTRPYSLIFYRKGDEGAQRLFVSNYSVAQCGCIWLERLINPLCAFFAFAVKK
jgi:hypothetical protein